jgi:hypothetical protein
VLGGWGQATTPRALRSRIASQSRPSSPRIWSPCSLNSGARGGTDGDAGAGPERERVVGALVGFGAALALAGSPYVDDARVGGADRLDVDLEPLADARKLVGQEDVRGRRELVGDLEPVGRREIETEALLAAVGVLQHRVHLPGHEGDAARGEPAHRVTPGHVLDLDHLGTQVGEHGGGGGHERVFGHLQDANAFENPRHVGCYLQSNPALRSGSAAHESNRGDSTRKEPRAVNQARGSSRRLAPPDGQTDRIDTPATPGAP